MYKEKLALVDEHFAHRSVNSSDIGVVGQLLSHKDIFELIAEIIHDQSLLEKIAQRSYTHALGFDKIVLMDLSKDVSKDRQKTQVRLHIWNPLNDSLPIVESLHEHSFDFISTVLSGRLENQMFLLSPLSEKENILLERLKQILSQAEPTMCQFINDQLEYLEARRLAKIGSQQFIDSDMEKALNLDLLKQVTNFSESELEQLVSLEGHYVSNRRSGERSSYQHVLQRYVSLMPYSVFCLSQGDFYFHPYQMPHRLYYDNRELNSTVLITTPVPSNPEGGSLQRPSYTSSDSQSYSKIPFDSERLKTSLLNYLEQMKDRIANL